MVALVPIASFFRKVRRALTPPGNRPPVDEAGATLKPPTAVEPQSMGGANLEQQSHWSAGP
jgi:hypothetical protein